MGSFCGRNIDQQLKVQLLQVSYQFYQVGDRFEKSADSVHEAEAEAKQELLLAAKEAYHKAIQCAPEDRATKTAWIRINAKLDSNFTVFKISDGVFGIGNTSDGTATLDLDPAPDLGP